MVAQGAAPRALGLGVRSRARARGEDADDLIPGERGYVDVAAPGEAADRGDRSLLAGCEVALNERIAQARALRADLEARA